MIRIILNKYCSTETGCGHMNQIKLTVGNSGLASIANVVEI
jgi:hypothetical protein